MEINETPKLIGNSIIFEDEDGTFIYNQNKRKVVHLKNLNGYILNELRQYGFFEPMPSIDPSQEIMKYNNLILLLTRDCILRCRYCYADAGINNAMMTIDIADKAAKWYLFTKPIRPKIIFLGGGEPTLNIPVIKYLISKYRNSIKWVLTTSGVLSQSFLEWLIENKVSITFSVDGPPDIQNYLRPLKKGEPSASLVEDSIKVLKRNERHLSIRTTITNQTVNRIGEITDYFKELGVHTLHLEALYSLGRATQTESNLSQPIIKDWVNAAVDTLKWGKQNNKLVTIHALIHFFNPNLCNFCGPMCGNTTVINHQGMLTSCSEVVDDENKDWDIFFLGELNQFPKIDKEKLTYLANRTTANMNICKNCFAKYICRGGCAYRGFTASGEIYSPDPRHCEFIKTILPIIIKRMAIGEYKVHQ